MVTITEVKNDGKFPGLFNAFLGLIATENKANRILNDKECLIGSSADAWILPDQGISLALSTAAKIAQLGVDYHVYGSVIFAFEYHGGLLFFVARSESHMIERCKKIEDKIYTAFGHAYIARDATTACGAV